MFYVGKILRESAMANPTAVLLPDRTDLDDQLYDEVFAPARTLPEPPVQAQSREHLRKLTLAEAAGEHVVWFATWSAEDWSSRAPHSMVCERRACTGTGGRSQVERAWWCLATARR